MCEKLKSYVILPKASRLNNVLSKISTVEKMVKNVKSIMKNHIYVQIYAIILLKKFMTT